MAKKKAKAAKLTDLQTVWQLFCKLHFNDQQEFVDKLPMSMVIKHPHVRRHEDYTQMEKQLDPKNRKGKKLDHVSARRAFVRELREKGVEFDEVSSHYREKIESINGGPVKLRTINSDYYS